MRMKTKALALLATPPVAAHESSFAAACRFLSYLPESAVPLFDAARRSRGKRRAVALDAAASAARRQNATDRSQFVMEHMSELLTWLREDDAEVQLAVQRILFNDFFTDDDGQWRRRSGLDSDVRIVAACRQILDAYPGRLDFSCLLVIADASPELDPGDVERVAAALERNLLVFQTNYERTSFKPQGALDPTYVQFFDRLGKYRDRPTVRRILEIRRSLEADGVIAPPRR
jgi:hypothetical protein